MRTLDKKLFEFWLKHWKVQSLPAEIATTDIDFVIVPSFGMCKEDIPKASKANLAAGIKWQKAFFPSAYIVVTTCSYTGAELEHAMKEKLLQEAGIPKDRIIWVENIDSTIHEGDRILAELQRRRLHPRHVLGVTGEGHSRSFNTVYSALLLDAEIWIDCIPFDLEFQPDHLITDQTTSWKWCKSNLVREAVLNFPYLPHLKFIGFWIARHAPHHKVNHQHKATG